MAILSFKNTTLKYDVSDSRVYWHDLNLGCRSMPCSPHPGTLQKHMPERENEENLCSESKLIVKKLPETRRDKLQFYKTHLGS